MVKIDIKKWQTVTKILILSIGQEQKKEQARDQSLRLEIQKYLNENKMQFAVMKAAEIVRIRNRCEVYEVIKMYTEQLTYDLPLIQRAPSCPETILPQIHGLVYATNAISVKYLLQLSDLIKTTFGKDFYNIAKSEQSYAEEQFKQMVMFIQPSEEQVNQIIGEVNEYSVRQNIAVQNYDEQQKQQKQSDVNTTSKGNSSGPKNPNDGGTQRPGGNSSDDDLEALKRRLANM